MASNSMEVQDPFLVLGLIDWFMWFLARSHQAIQCIYISVHQQKLEIEDFIKHLRNTNRK